MVNDTIADMLTRIRNSNKAKHQIVKIRATKMTEALAKILLNEDFIRDYSKIRLTNNSKYLLIYLKYKRNRSKDPIIQNIDRISRPGLRSYIKYSGLDLNSPNSKTLILSTSKGVMTGRDAHNQQVGGEVLCCIG